jgi:L-rhamnose mutarotase
LALRAAGVHDWRIWRDGQDLFHLVTVEDYKAMRHALAEHPANVAWQATVGPLHDEGIRFVWGLPVAGSKK